MSFFDGDVAAGGEHEHAHEEQRGDHEQPAGEEDDPPVVPGERHGLIVVAGAGSLRSGWAAGSGRSLTWPPMRRSYRVVIAKPGLDGHDRGAKVIARALRDAGFEVIYTGLYQTPEQVAETTLQEDADAVGLSVLSGAHLTLFPASWSCCRERDLGHVVVFGGGIIPDDDVATLSAAGVARVFTPGTPLQTITDWLEQALDDREAQLTG